VCAESVPMHGYAQSAAFVLPPLAAIILQPAD
jgi:hypothetical protein